MSLPGLTEPEAERLSLIRYQLLATAEAAEAPPPINSLAINSMQDVMEAALHAAAEHLNVALPNRPDFDKLYDATAEKLGSPAELLGLRAAALALNSARVGFKHHGNQVRDETLRRHFDVAATLVNTVIELAFGTSLEQVSMLLFVQDEQARGLIEDADKHFQSGDLVAGLFRLRLAFDLIVKEYESRKSVTGWDSIFKTKPSFFPSTFDLRDMLGREGGRKLEKFQEWIQALDDLTRLGALGIDLQRYSYFDAVTPRVWYFASDSAPKPNIRFEAVTAEHYRASYLFVVDAAIRLGANDYTLMTTRGGIHRERHYNPDYVGKTDIALAEQAKSSEPT
ncbi:MAG: hypothetical protein JWR04_1300 [Rhodoglobus sp.]|nr:hypothetical protein [Rhodoglobus sp.]